MDKQTILRSHFVPNLSDSLQEWLGFDVACGSTDFCDDDICPAGLATGVDEVLYFICDVRNDLDSASKVFTISLFLKDVPIYFSTGKVRELGKILVNEFS